MKIAIDISPLESGHKVRGVGFYLHHLKEALTSYYPDNDYIFFTGKVPPDKSINLVHYPYFDPFFLTLPLFRKQKTVVTVHDLIPVVFSEYFPAGYRGKVKWLIQRLALQQCDGIITDSLASKRDILTYAGVSEKKIRVVYLAAGKEFKRVDLPAGRQGFQHIRKKYNLPEKFVLYVGDVTWNKNLPRLLEAVKKADVPLIMVGKTLGETAIDVTNPWNADLLVTQQMAKENQNVHILGFVPTEDLVTLYNSATVTVVPSLYEGFGLPILEAMSCGSPVVTTKKGSIPEVAGEAAWYVDAQSSSSIATGIGEVFFNDTLQQALREKGFEQVKHFSWQRTAEETLAAYEETASQSTKKILQKKIEKQKHYETEA